MRLDGERKFGFEIGNVLTNPYIAGKFERVEQTDVAGLGEISGVR